MHLKQSMAKMKWLMECRQKFKLGTVYLKSDMVHNLNNLRKF